MKIIKKIPRVVIAATQSGSGKTTVVAGLLQALRRHKITPQAYKVGPDYIDPGYHELASGRPTHNLDSWLLTPNKLRAGFARQASDADIAVIEGVMGLYDGGKGGISSTAEIAKMLNAPVVPVIDAKSMGASAAAIALGFRVYDPEVNLAGVILNRLGSDTHCQMITEAMQKIGVPVLGAIRRDDDLKMPERHLGLVPTEENAASAVIAAIGDAVNRQVDLATIINLANAAPPFVYDDVPPPAQIEINRKIIVAVAKDPAFSFYYPDSLATLTDLGAKIVYFSPLADEPVPDADGIIIGGGFPEMFAARLAANVRVKESLRRAAQRGTPIYAECGGYMYLMRELTDFDGNVYPMTGILPGRATMQKKLQMVGYVTARFTRDNILGKAGEEIRGHEFHFSRDNFAEPVPTAFRFTRLRNGESYEAGYAGGNILASYLHINFAGATGAAKNFLASCRLYFTSQKSQYLKF